MTTEGWDNDQDQERKRRRRTTTKRFEFDSLDNEEQKLMQQAIRNSQKDVKRVEVPIPDAPVYYPSLEEWKNPLKYINTIRTEAEQYGICKIVPPKEWNPTCQINFNNVNKFATKAQNVNKLQEGGNGFDEGKHYDLREYKEMADKFYETWCKQHYGDAIPSHEQIAKDYWMIVETQCEKAFVEYGNDIDTKVFGSGFPDNDINNSDGIETNDCNDMFSEEYYKRTGWNLNNMAGQEGSVLKHLETPINGVNVPWLYIGMLFSSFCWHNEDNYLYSINYSHFGAVKQWYGVPGGEAKTFEKVIKEFLLESFKESPDLLHHMTTQLSPSLLIKNNVPVYKISQDPKSFIVTFPKAFHCGFSYGFNCGEAVNFATIDWLLSGGEAEERYRTVNRGTVFSHHRLLFTLLNHKDEIISPQSRKELALEIFRVVDEEIAARPHIIQQGIRDISDKVILPPNNFDVIDEKSSTYDEMRCCCVCNHVCIFSAIACECSKEKIACIRHYHVMCKCSKEKKYLLSWAKTDFLSSLKREMDNALKGKVDFISEKLKEEQKLQKNHITTP